MKVIILNAYQVGSQSTCHPQAGEHKKLSATIDYDNEDNCVVILEKTVTLCIYHPPHLHQKTARMSVRTCSDVFSSVEKHSLPPTTLFQIFNTVKVHEKIHTIPYQSTPHCKRLKQLFLHVPGSRFHIFIMVAHST